MSRPGPDVVHIGSASRDLAPDDPRGWRLGGGVSYASLTTARLGLATSALIGVDKIAAGAVELDTLRAAGVDVHLVMLAEGPVFLNTETPAGRIQIAIARGVPLVAQPVPEAWLTARAWSLVPVAAEIGEGWIEPIPVGATVAVGWQGMLRTLVAGQPVTRRPPEPSAMLRRADLVGVSEYDLEPGTDPLELVGYLRPGARLVITRGVDGGSVIANDDADGAAPRISEYQALTAGSAVDATGAGDTFLAALLAVTVRPELLGDRSSVNAGNAGNAGNADARFAAAAASLTVGGRGLDGVGDLAAVRALLVGDTRHPV